MDRFVDMYRLVSKPDDPGLYCGKGELRLGGVLLLSTGGVGLEPRTAAEIAETLKAAYGGIHRIDLQSCLSALRTIARALNQGDLPRAMLTSLMMRLPNLDASGMDRLAKTDALLRANFNALQPRNRDGEWDGGGSSIASPAGWTVTVPIPFPPILFPGIYGKPKPKDDYVFPPYPGQAEAHQGVNDNATTHTQAAANDNQPHACPDPSYEKNSGKRTRQQLLYQAQINKLPLGWGVELNGVYYDGCRDSDDRMLEAKSGNDWFLSVPEFIKPVFDEYYKTMAQATRQNNNSGGRYIEWYFANEAISNYWAREFLKANLLHIFVRYTPYDEHYNYNLIRFYRANALSV